MSTSPDWNYKYEPLPSARSFRLLNIQPGEDNEPLVCELGTLELPSNHFDCNSLFPQLIRSCPSFQAISYVWGDSPATHNIWCDGRLVQIREYLKDALCQLRRPDEHILVWVDAICINQSDLRERRMQVALMRTIFSTAQIVSIFLGSNSTLSISDQSLLARTLVELDRKKIDTLENPGWSSIPRRHGSLPHLPSSSSIKVTAFQSYARLWGIIHTTSDDQNFWLDPSSGFWSLIAKFFDYPWFSRIWVIQEVAQSKQARVLFGREEIPWRTIVDLARWLLRNPYNGHRLSQSAKRNAQNVLFMNERRVFAASDPIPALLQSARDFSSSDPRDKVYAMLHMPIKRSRAYARFQLIDPWTYAELSLQGVSLICLLLATINSSLKNSQFWCTSMSLGYLAYRLRFARLFRAVMWDFYLRFANFCVSFVRVFLHDLQITDTLCGALNITADYSLTPLSIYKTVVERLVQRSRKLNILSYVNHGSAIDATYPSWVPRWDVSTNGVQVLANLPQHGFQSSAGIHHPLSLRPKHTDHLVVKGVRFSTVSSTSEVLRHTSFAELSAATRQTTAKSRAISHHGVLEAASLTGKSLRGALLETLTAGRLTHISNASYRLLDSWYYQHKMSVALGACYGRRYFVTENGHMGIGPAAMRDGDVVCILFGGCVPYILRPTDADGLYKLVGESYVHGVMRGEVINDWRQEKRAREWFTLC